MNSRWLRPIVYAAIFVVAFAVYVTRITNSGGLTEPPEAGDGHDYDAIAFNVWKGRGFGYHWSDEAWREPYVGIPRYGPLLTRQSDYYPTTYRPPGMPLLVAGVYAVAGRNFAAWRILNCGITAGAVTAAAIVSAQFAGVPAAVLTAAVALRSRELTRYSGMYMTESLAAFFAALLALCWVRNAQHGWTTRRAVISGAVLAGLIASRTIFVLWLPVLLVLPGKDRSFGSRFAWRMKALSLVVAIVVISPWWIRNIIVTNAFMPLGTQGAINLPMGFGPRAIRSQGIWASNPGDGWPEIAARKLDVVTSEVLLAQHRSKLAINWMVEHPAEVLELMRLHVWQEFRARRDALWRWTFPAAAVSLLIFPTHPAAWTIALMVGATILSIAMTYSAGGRFLVPAEPLVIALAAAMIIAVPLRLWKMLRQRV